jgi:palmitoyltransferase
MPASAKPSSNFRMPEYATIQDEIDAFNRRKQEHMKRFEQSPGLQRRKPFHDRHGTDDYADSESDDSDEGEESWRTAEGERLRDFGVDEEAEFYDEEDIPLAVLIQRRNQEQSLI